MKFFVITALIFGSLFFVFGLVKLSDYGLNLDETKHYWRGHTYLHFLLIGRRDYSDLSSNSKKSFYQNAERAADFTFEKDSGHPVTNDILAAFFNTILYQKLGILPDLEAHHVFTLLVSSICVGVISWFVSYNYGLFSGLISVLSFSLYPLFLGESRFNIKDPVEASFYTLTIIFFYTGIVKAKYKFILASAVSAGLALGTKFNIFFAAPTIGIWIFFVKDSFMALFKRKDRDRFLFCFFSYPFIAFGIFFFSWPYLWDDPIKRTLEIFNYYQKIGYGITYQSPEYLTVGGINTYGAQWILYTTPIITLILATMGIIYVIRNGFSEKYKLSVLALLWVTIPIVRTSMPKAGIYGGVRQIMEYVPAMAILAGIGARDLIVLLLPKQLKNVTLKHLKTCLQIVLIASFIPITLKMISIHPNENVFMNSLVGGLAGARQRKLDHWGNTFGNAYRQGVNWLNVYAEQGAMLVSGGQFDENILHAWLRPDIQYLNNFRSGFARGGEYAIEMTGDNAIMAHLFYLTYLKNFLIPVYEVRVDGVPILTIWKNDAQHTRLEYLQKKEIAETVDSKNITNKDTALVIKLDSPIMLTGITIKFADSSCKFTSNGFFRTLDGNTWTTHTGNLESVMFFNQFNPRAKLNELSYIFAGEHTKEILIEFEKDNTCLRFPGKIIISRLD